MFMIVYFLAKPAAIDPMWLSILFVLAVIDGILCAIELGTRAIQNLLTWFQLANE